MIEFECEEDRIEAYKEASTVTKEALLKRVNESLIIAEMGTDDALFKKHSASFRRRYIELLRKFRDELQTTMLFDELEPYWSYSFEIDESGVTLHLQYASDFCINDDGMLDLVFIGQDFELLKVCSKLLTVEEYAELYEVTVSAVRQWIRRGKIRSAIKAGKEWRIPELTEISSRGYKRGIYKWPSYIDDFPEEYAFLRECESLSIDQSDKDKSVFVIRARKKHDDGLKVSIHDDDVLLTMDAREREKFELFLIGHPLIKAESEFYGAFG